jgi:hypothetical protein
MQDALIYKKQKIVKYLQTQIAYKKPFLFKECLSCKKKYLIDADQLTFHLVAGEAGPS